MAASAAAPLRVLVADDQPDVRMALRLLLKMEGFHADDVDSPTELLHAASRRPYDLILMDLNYTRDTTSGQEGLDTLVRLKQLPTAPPAIVMTAWSSIELAVEAMRRGAVDFVTKPWDNPTLIQTLRKSARRAERPTDDLSIARRVQSKLFPQAQPQLTTLEYKATCVEAGPVGGDYYDFLDFGPGHVGLVLADVCGKGMAAALLMANLQATLRSLCRNAPLDWAALMSQANQLFYQTTSPEHYATLFAADYSDRSRTLRYINCGHNPPLHLDRDGNLRRLNTTALVVGAFRRFNGTMEEVRLEPGEWLMLFSDGIVEAQNDAGDMFGEERLQALLAENRHRTVDEMEYAVHQALDAFASPYGRDDWTLVLLRGR